MKNTKSLKLSTICIYFFWLILMVGKGLGYTGSNPILQLMTYIAVPFAIVKLLLTKWHKNELIKCIAINIMGILIWIFTKEPDVLLTTLALTSIKDIDIYKLFKFFLWIRGILFVVITSLSLLGFRDMQETWRYLNGMVTSSRYGLGYGHPNAAQYTLFSIIAMAILVYHNRMKLYHYILFALYALFIYRYTDSNSGIVLTLLLLIMAYVAERKGGIVLRKALRIAGSYSYLIGATISFLICFLFSKIDLLRSYGTLSSRFLTGTDIINKNSITLFGTPNIVTDFGYIKMLYGSGIIFFIFFIIEETILTKRIINNNQYIEACILIIYAIYTLTEAYTGSILMNMSLLLLALTIYPNSNNSFLNYSPHRIKKDKFRMEKLV